MVLICGNMFWNTTIYNSKVLHSKFLKIWRKDDDGAANAMKSRRCKEVEIHSPLTLAMD